MGHRTYVQQKMGHERKKIENHCLRIKNDDPAIVTSHSDKNISYYHIFLLKLKFIFHVKMPFIVLVAIGVVLYYALGPSALEYVALSQQDKLLFVKEHNDYRRKTKPVGSNIQEMVWDEEIARYAAARSSKCYFGHSDRSARKTSKFKYIGENIYAATFANDLANSRAIMDTVESWYEEIKDYSYNSDSCNPNAVCGHYTQVVWATSYALGCGITKCKNFRFSRGGKAWDKAVLVFCSYGPGGNFAGQKPYESGAACSKCSKSSTCNNGLCKGGATNDFSSNQPQMKPSLATITTTLGMITVTVIVSLG